MKHFTLNQTFNPNGQHCSKKFEFNPNWLWQHPPNKLTSNITEPTPMKNLSSKLTFKNFSINMTSNTSCWVTLLIQIPKSAVEADWGHLDLLHKLGYDSLLSLASMASNVIGLPYRAIYRTMKLVTFVHKTFDFITSPFLENPNFWIFACNTFGLNLRWNWRLDALYLIK